MHGKIVRIIRAYFTLRFNQRSRVVSWTTMWIIREVRISEGQIVRATLYSSWPTCCSVVSLSGHLLFFHFVMWPSCWLGQPILLPSSKTLNVYTNVVSLHLWRKSKITGQLHLNIAVFTQISGCQVLHIHFWKWKEYFKCNLLHANLNEKVDSYLKLWNDILHIVKTTK